MDFLLLQIADSAFPVGGFAHSGGLEAAWQRDELTSVDDWTARYVRSLGRAALPFVNAAHRRPHELRAIDERCNTFITQHVARRASVTQGAAFAATCARSFGITRVDGEHFAPVFGAVLRILSVNEDDTRALFVHTALRGVLSAAVRLGVCGSYESQQIQRRLGSLCAQVCADAARHDLDDAAQIDPLFDVLQGQHDALYSRLFQT